MSLFQCGECSLETLTASLADLETPDSAIDCEEDMGESTLWHTEQWACSCLWFPQREWSCYHYAIKIKKKQTRSESVNTWYLHDNSKDFIKLWSLYYKIKTKQNKSMSAGYPGVSPCVARSYRTQGQRHVLDRLPSLNFCQKEKQPFTRDPNWAQ